MDVTGQSAGLQVLWWVVAVAVVGILGWAVVSLSRSPLDVHRRLPWVVALFVLPVVGPAVWLWWRYWYYPRRRAEEPEWDPNDRTVTVNPPRRPGR